MLYKFCPEIPNIPEELSNFSEEDIRKIKDEFTGVKLEPGSKPVYTLHNTPLNIKNFLLPYFEEHYDFAFQLITTDLPIHKDFERRTCYNYIFSSGGDVNTVWYDDNLQQIESVIFPERVWHNIRVDTFHNVTNVSGTRIALTVWEKDETAIGKIC